MDSDGLLEARVALLEARLARMTVDSPLSPRQGEALQLAAHGHSSGEIALLMKISESSLRTHFTAVFQKLNARDRTHAVAIALRRGWIR